MNKDQWQQLTDGSMFRGNDFACKVSGRFTDGDIWAKIIGARRMNDRQLAANTFRIHFSENWSGMDLEEWISVLRHGFGAPDQLARPDREFMHQLNADDCAYASPRDTLGPSPRAGFNARCPHPPKLGYPVCETHVANTLSEGGWFTVENIRAQGKKINVTGRTKPSEVFGMIDTFVADMFRKGAIQNQKIIDSMGMGSGGKQTHSKYCGFRWMVDPGGRNLGIYCEEEPGHNTKHKFVHKHADGETVYEHDIAVAPRPTYEIFARETHCGVCGASSGCMHPRDKRITNRR